MIKLVKGRELHVPRYAVGLRGVLKNEKPDIIFAAEIFEWTTWQCLHYAKKHSTQLYIFSETRDWPRSRFSRWAMVLFVKLVKRNQQYVTGVIVWTKQGEEWFARNLPGIQVLLLPAPVDTTQFYPDINRQYLPDGTLRILMNARYVALKDHKTFFRALAILQQKNVPFQVSLIGRGGHLEQELQAYAQELGIDSHLTWLAPVPSEQLRDIYNQHDTLVLASYREAIGMVVPEAMACGLATVTSEAVGANTYVVEGETGYIFKTGDAEQLAEKLACLADPVTTARLGQRAAAEIQQHYTADVLGDRMLRVLQG